MSRLLKGCMQLAVLWLALQAVSLAQGPGPRPKPWGPGSGPPPEPQDDRRGPPGPPDRRPRPGVDFPAFETMSGGKVVKGAPYSATAIIETELTLSGGAKIIRKSTDLYYRDSEGRTRREQTFDRFGPFLVDGEPRQVVFINDVVAGLHLFLDPGRRVARKRPMPDGPPRPMPMPPPLAAGERTSESLGKQLIEGIEAEGTRTTITIPTGRIGNDRPLEVVSERWESPALQIVVLSKVKDPFIGDTTYRLVDIKRGEQPRALFEIPADYTLEEGKDDRPDHPPPGDRRKSPPKVQ